MSGRPMLVNERLQTRGRDNFDIHGNMGRQAQCVPGRSQSTLPYICGSDFIVAYHVVRVRSFEPGLEGDVITPGDERWDACAVTNRLRCLKSAQGALEVR